MKNTTYWKNWIAAAGMRAVKTVAQTAIATIPLWLVCCPCSRLWPVCRRWRDEAPAGRPADLAGCGRAGPVCGWRGGR